MKNTILSESQTNDLDALRRLAAQERVSLYIVGGFLRDHVLGRSQKDIDFAVSKDALPLAKIFAKTIKGAFVLLDEEFGCARVVKKHGDDICTYDFADYRAKTIQGDMRNRDFTVNALCLNLNDFSEGKDWSGKIKDYTGGLEDLNNKRIRVVSQDTFKQDPLRLMRAFSLRAQYGFKMEASTLALIKEDALRVTEVSMERVRDELFKVLSSDKAGSVLEEMDRYGLLAMVIPPIRLMYDVYQGGYHHLDVWKHTLEAVKQADKVCKEARKNKDVEKYLSEPLAGGRSRQSLIKLALVLHDIGKPETKQEADGRMSFHTHEHVGKRITRGVAQTLKLSTKERHAVEDMVKYHLRPGYLSNFEEPTKKMVFRYFRDTADEAVAILLLSLADQRATRGPLTSEKDQKHHETICMNLVQDYFVKKEETPRVCLIDGQDLIQELGLTPSPLFKVILSKVEEHQGIGKITTRQQALALAKNIASS